MPYKLFFCSFFVPLPRKDVNEESMYMKKLYIIGMLCLCAGLMSCGGGGEQKEKVNEQTYQPTETSETGEFEMQESSAEGSATVNRAEYRYRIHRKPSRQLPLVKDEQGNRFVDNVIEMKISRGDGKQVASKRFTKRDFASHVDAKFLSNSILEGLVFDRVVDGRLRFAASVCYPQTDLFVPLCILVGTDGSIRVEKGSVLEESIPGGEE